jgi:hypothetical protein
MTDLHKCKNNTKANWIYTMCCLIEYIQAKSSNSNPWFLVCKLYALHLLSLDGVSTYVRLGHDIGSLVLGENNTHIRVLSTILVQKIIRVL